MRLQTNRASLLGVASLCLLSGVHAAVEDNDKEPSAGDLRGVLDTSSSSQQAPLSRKLQQDGESLEPIDLNFRFNKFSFTDDNGNDFIPDFMPLGAKDYPIRDETIAWALKNQSNAVSVLCDGDPALNPNHQTKVHHYLNAIGGLPTMPRVPSADVHHLDRDDDEFWNEFRHVTQLQLGRRNNMAPATIMRGPDLWMQPSAFGNNVVHSSSIHQVAMAVHNEYPGQLQVELIQWLWSQPRDELKVDYDILPFRSQRDFVGLQVAMSDLNTWAIGVVAPMNFYLKWFAGRPRPEEVAWAITNGQLSYDHGVPPDVVQMVESMDLKSPAEYTAYPEGSPRHPSWPAMHSAASSASFWIAVVLDLTPAQYCEALRVDYAVAFARTCAGVHYPTDNTAGLNLGQTILSETLADHLATAYGSDPVKVQAKIDRLRFDWANFDSYGCTGMAKLE